MLSKGFHTLSPATVVSFSVTVLAFVLSCSCPPATAQLKPDLNRATPDAINSDDKCSKYSLRTDEKSRVLSRYDAAVVKRAKTFYQKSIVITAHDHCYAPSDFKDMEKGGITARTIKLTSDNVHWEHGEKTGNGPGVKKEDRWAGEQDFFKPAVDAVEKIKNTPNVIVIRNLSDIARAKSEGKLGVIISFEGGAVVPRRPDDNRCQNDPIKDECLKLARDLHKLGLRDFQPYWGPDNWLKKKSSKGNKEYWSLNPYGLAVLHEMDRMGVVIDLSHMGPDPFKQALKILDETHKPFILSHAGIAQVELCGTRRDCDERKEWNEMLGEPGNTGVLDRATICAVVVRHGVIGLNFEKQFFPKTLSPSHEATIEDLVDEIAYIRDNFGIDYIALGPDYIPSTEKGDTWIDGARNMAEMENVAKEMVSRQFSDLEIKKVLGLNLMRVYGEVWNSAAPRTDPTYIVVKYLVEPLPPVPKSCLSAGLHLSR